MGSTTTGKISDPGCKDRAKTLFMQVWSINGSLALPWITPYHYMNSKLLLILLLLAIKIVF